MADEEFKWFDATTALREELKELFPRFFGSHDVLADIAKADGGSSALCLSGGGIRSATFSLGVLQGLAEKDRLSEYDYLSTVSGGGYIGAWLSRWRVGDPKAPDPRPPRDSEGAAETPDDGSRPAHLLRRLRGFILSKIFRGSAGREREPEPAPEPPGLRIPGDAAEALKETPDDRRAPRHPLRRLRSFSNYLSPSWGLSTDTLTVASIFLRNLLLNFLFWIPFLLLVAILPWVAITLARWTIATDGLAVGPFVFDHFQVAAFGVPALMAGMWILGVLIILLSGWSMEEEGRESFSRIAAGPLMVGIPWLLLFAAFVYLPWWVQLQMRIEQATAGQSAFAIAGGGLFAVLTGMAGYWSRYGPDLRRKAYGIADALGARLLDLLALLSLLVLAVAASLAVRAWLLFWSVGEGPFVYWKQTRADGWIFAYTIFGLVVTVALAGFFVGANRFSLHALYGNRLVRAYLGSARMNRHPSPGTDFDPRDNVDMTALPGGKDWPEGEPKRPFHVVNMTLNLARRSSDALDWQERKGASFTATPIFCGSPATGYVRSQHIGGADDMNRPTGMTLGRAMTISGAAASPNMGYHGSPLMALVMTFFNIRLGWWVPNPRRLRKPRLRQEPLYGLGLVLREAFSGTDSRSKWLYLSDGGHFDNLGLYEMVRRRCRRIVVVDSGCDGEFKYADLHNAIRKIEVDLAVPIDLQADLPGQEGFAEDSRVAIGTLRYSALHRDYKDGRLYLIKPVLLGDEPPSLREYAEISRRHGKTFPHHSTADQFFNETQFESYRRLGQWSVKALLAAIEAENGDIEKAKTATLKRRKSATAPPAAAPDDSPQRDLPPRAILTGFSGLEESVRALSPLQMVAGALATAGAVGAAATVGHKAADQMVEVVWPSSKEVGVISTKMDSRLEGLLEHGVTVRADENSLKRIADIQTALNTLLENWKRFSDGRSGDEVDIELLTEIQNVATALQAHAGQSYSLGDVSAKLDPNSLQSLDKRLEKLATLDRLEKLEASNGRALVMIVNELRTIAARLQDTNPRRNVRGS